MQKTAVQDPISWAAGLVTFQGTKDAHRIINYYRQVKFGKDKDISNPYAGWYERAYKWVMKNHPLPLSEQN
jgi:hypothetical protein